MIMKVMEEKNIRNFQKSIEMKKKYKEWKLNSLDESGYFVIFQGFLETNKLKNLSGNALKLYIYLGINSSNLEGVVWHSTETISKYFDKAERTIRTWIKELEDNNLIKRMRLKYNGKQYTYLIPYQSKKINELENIIKGILYVNSNNNLVILDDSKVEISVPRKSMINIFYNNEWICGKIYSKRNNISWGLVNYVFQSEDGLKLNLESNCKFAAEIIIYK